MKYAIILLAFLVSFKEKISIQIFDNESIVKTEGYLIIYFDMEPLYRKKYVVRMSSPFIYGTKSKKTKPYGLYNKGFYKNYKKI